MAKLRKAEEMHPVYYNGRFAYKEGDHIESCPYKESLFHITTWKAGWNDAQLESERDLRCIEEPELSGWKDCISGEQE